MIQKASDQPLLGKLFECEATIHPDFGEKSTENFVAKILAGEKRPDNFVTAHRPSPMQLAAAMLSVMDSEASYSLQLNCQLPQVQLNLTFTPKFLSLKKIVLIVTCAPSIEKCYVFELVTKHSLRDWTIYDVHGIEAARRWYKLGWSDDTDYLVGKIVGGLEEIVHEAISASEESS